MALYSIFGIGPNHALHSSEKVRIKANSELSQSKKRPSPFNSRLLLSILYSILIERKRTMKGDFQMSTFNPVVNHVSDDTKVGGIVESYQYIPMEFDVIDEDTGEATGQKITKFVRVNFVAWPGHPVPFLHEEFSENLYFDNVYVGSIDEDDREEAEQNAEIVSLLEDNYPEVYAQLKAEVENGEEDVDDNEEATEGEEEQTVN